MDPIPLVLFGYLGHVKQGRSTRTRVGRGAWGVRQHHPCRSLKGARALVG